MTDSSHIAAPTRDMDMRLAVACGLAIMMRTYQPWLFDNGIVPAVGAVFAPAYKIQMAVRVLIEFLVLLAAMRAPRLLRPRPLLGGSFACCIAGVVLLNLVPVSPVSITIGLIVRLAGHFFGFYVIGIALSQIGETRIAATSTSCAVLAATFIARLAPAPGLSASVALDAILTLGSIALTWRAAEPVLNRIAGFPGGNLWALVNPKSFLVPNHQVFLLIFFFSVAMGFGMFLRIEDLTPRGNNLSIVVLAGVLLWFIAVPNKRGHMREDALFSACALLAVAGFLLSPLEDSGGENGKRASVRLQACLWRFVVDGPCRPVRPQPHWLHRVFGLRGARQCVRHSIGGRAWRRMQCGVGRLSQNRCPHDKRHRARLLCLCPHRAARVFIRGDDSRD